MNIGALFPQSQIGSDPIVIRDFAQAAEDLGYTHLLAGEHILGATHEGRDPQLTGANTDQDAWHEPLVLFGYLSGVTTRIGLATGVLILPQRQTALVAKQAAEVDILSGGRLRLGIGLGWNHVEFEALNVDFANRGQRAEEQIDVLRKLWSEPLLDYTGEWHRIDRASILPRPEGRIPIWFGARTKTAIRRAARLGDGFIFSGVGDQPAVLEQAELVRGLLAEEGRDPKTFGLEVIVGAGDGPDAWRAELQAYVDAGFSHVAVRTTQLANAQERIDRLAHYMREIEGVVPS